MRQLSFLLLLFLLSVASAQPDPDAELRAAKSLVNAGKTAESLAAYEKFLKAHPDHAYAFFARYTMANLRMQRKDFAGAMNDYQRVIDDYPFSLTAVEAQVRIGHTLAAQGKKKDATESYVKAVRLYRANVSVETGPNVEWLNNLISKAKETCGSNLIELLGLLGTQGLVNPFDRIQRQDKDDEPPMETKTNRGNVRQSSSASSRRSGLRWFAGDMHVHCHPHGCSTVPERVQEAMGGGLDFVALTNHKREALFRGADEMAAQHRKFFPKISVLVGMEWDDLSGLNGDDVIVFGVDPKTAPPSTLQDAIDWVNQQGGVFIFAHPADRVKAHWTTYQGATAFEGFTASNWNQETDVGKAWDELLNVGERVFIVGSSDNHAQKFLGERIVKTYVGADSNRPADIVRALRAGRMFVSEQDRVRIEAFTVNGKMMGDTVTLPAKGNVSVKFTITSLQPLSNVTLVSNKQAVWTWTPPQGERVYKLTQTVNLPVSAANGYLRLIAACAAGQQTTFKAMSNPVFLQVGQK
jgi:tetratricopeptide (TPR) repeat protein